jgi:hypothetical protein
MSGTLFACPVDLTPELIELHARVARDLRRATFLAMVRAATDAVQHWLHRPTHGRLAAGVR